MHENVVWKGVTVGYMLAGLPAPGQPLHVHMITNLTP